MASTCHFGAHYPRQQNPVRNWYPEDTRKVARNAADAIKQIYLALDYAPVMVTVFKIMAVKGSLSHVKYIISLFFLFFPLSIKTY